MKRTVFTVGGLLLVIGILFVILTVLSNLTRPQSTVITSTECDPPCWYGIWPGETTSWGATSILLDLPGVSSIDEGTRNPELKHITWKFRRPLGDAFGYIYLKDDHVAAISLSTIGSLTIYDAIERLGEPELILTSLRKSNAREWAKAILIYPTQGYQVDVDVDMLVADQDKWVEIDEDTPIYRVIYFEPTQYEYLIDKRILLDGLGITALDNAGHWQGYGVIKFEMK